MKLTWEYDFLGTIEPLDANEKGVYVIWLHNPATNRYRALYVGQGHPTRQRLEAHNDDPRILVYGRVDELVVSRAVVNLAPFRDSIERFLANVCQPLVGEKHPGVKPLPVNLPFRRNQIEGLKVLAGIRR